MSQALASAKKRALQPPQNTRFPSSQSSTYNPTIQPSTPATGMTPNAAALTLPQVITLVDKRLVVLEKFMNDSKTNIIANEPSANVPVASIPPNISELLDEYNSRFDIIADELANLKNTLLSLQTFTMEVNKKMFDERVRILSEEPVDNANIELSIEQ